LNTVQSTIETLFTWIVPSWINSHEHRSFQEQCSFLKWTVSSELIQRYFLRTNSFNKPHIYKYITKHIIYTIYFKNNHNHNRINKQLLSTSMVAANGEISHDSFLYDGIICQNASNGRNFFFLFFWLDLFWFLSHP
jgi:hypothetical protein